MVIKSTQKIIKVGDSLAVTIPAKDARINGLLAGNEVEISVKLPKKQMSKTQLDKEYQAFKEQYGETLKNLADR